jgi:RNA polymerase sigma factor (sigma-70 family)
MRKIKSPHLAQLLMQLRFTPEGKRRKQLEAAERLYALVDEQKKYPYEFVCFHITGYQPRNEGDQEVLSGRDLLDDLQIFTAKLSGKLATSVDDAHEKVYTIEELAEKFGVATRTINRWRKRGLLARKFVFPDGGHRFGFLASVVEAFAREHTDLVDRATRFHRMTSQQRRQAVRLARSLGSKTALSRHQIVLQVAAKLGVARETIRYTLEQYEKKNGDRAVYQKRLGRLRPTEGAELYRLYRQGLGVQQLMKRFDRSRSSIHRIVNQRRAAALLAHKIEYVPSDEFLEPGVKESILGKPLSLAAREHDRRIEPFELVGEHLLPEYLQVLKSTPVLTREQEVELFRRYNFLKWYVAGERHHLRLSRVSATLLSELEDYLEQAEEIRRMLVEANLRLVVSIASKHSGLGANFADLVSKGNFALIEAVEQFDYTTGHRFSRRASLNIAKEYAKVSGRSTELTARRAASVATVQRGLRETTAGVLAVERARHDLAQVIREELDDREQYVILHHFGLTGSSVKKNTKTLKEIGDHLGLTKERVRQIELAALQKLRQCLSKEQFELLTG